MAANERVTKSTMPDVTLDDPVVLVVMGVSGSGKTTVGRELANRLGWPFFEGDDLHPEANVEKMEGGEPLADADRQPWLEEIRDLAARLLDDDDPGVIACSALKRSYRELIAGGRGDAVRFVYLEGGYESIKKRMEGRDGHFMKADLLQSQFDALEVPDPDEPNVLAVSIDYPPEAAAVHVARWLNDS